MLGKGGRKPRILREKPGISGGNPIPSFPRDALKWGKQRVLSLLSGRPQYFSALPCLSLWEKWSRAARTEKVNGGAYIDTRNGAYLY